MNSHPYIEQLITNCKIAQEAIPESEYEISSIEELHKMDDIRKGIYVIEELGGNQEKTFQEFSDFKDRKVRACAKLNEPSKFLYVGSSTTGIKKRLLQHLDEGPEGTYALHMGHWFQGKFKVKIMTYNVELPVLQIIEDSISFNLKPAFGKQGGNNRF